MNVIVQEGQLVHIALHEPQARSDQQFSLSMLGHMLDMHYEGSELLVTRNRYGVVTDINIRFGNIEDATHFKLTHLWNGEDQ